jgi:serpin B
MPTLFINSESTDRRLKLPKFSLNFYELFAAILPNKNFVISPASFALATGLVLQGASGETKREIEKAFNVKQLENLANQVNSDESVKSANKVYISKNFTLQKSYLEKVKRIFDSEAEKVDFTLSNQTAQKINKWIEEKTRGLIKNLIKSESLNNKTAAMLINAIYFKGNWNKSFNVLETKEEFKVLPNKSKMINFMQIKDKFYLRSFDDLEVSVLELPYKDSSMSMVILLPFEDDGLKNLEQNLTPLKLRKLLKTDTQKYEIEVTMPRFKIESENKLNDVAKMVRKILI